MLIFRNKSFHLFLILTFIVLSGCAAGPALVNIGGTESLIRDEFEPLAEYKNGSELEFCALEKLDKRFYFQNYKYYLGSVDPINVGGEKNNIAPFKLIESISENEDPPCDVLLEITQAQGSFYPPFTIVASSVYSGEKLMSAEAGGRGGYTQLHGLPRVLRIVYNAFVPGTPLYKRVAEERQTEQYLFERETRYYRESQPKPSLPESARKFKVQAEAAFNRKDFEEAAKRYGDALKIAPWWPEGHFNRALILGELGRNKAAIKEMRKYLLLVPDASDARAAQDRIYQWESLDK